jgi:hypothetical protein
MAYGVLSPGAHRLADRSGVVATWRSGFRGSRHDGLADDLELIELEIELTHMKLCYTPSTIRPPGLRTRAASLLALAGLVHAAAGSDLQEAPTPFVSGTLDLSGNTHFVSYGQDIWGTGNDWGHNSPIFNPSIELTLDLGKGWSGMLGTWWDVNRNAPSDIGNAIQEVDVWAGVGYGVGDFSFTLLYQEWLYAGQSERIVDFVIGYDHWLNPSLTLHGRVDHDIGPDFKNGLTTVLGVAPGKDFGPVSVSLPLNVAFDTDGMHGGDAGFSFASAGIDASVPLTFVTKGNWSLNGGIAVYHTDDDVIVGNPDDTFVTARLGVSLGF